MRDLVWRWYTADRRRLVLALMSLAILFVIRNRASYRRLMGAGLVVGLVVLGWLLYKPLSPTALLHSPQGPIVKNGVAAVVVCGDKRDAMWMYGPDIAPEPQTGAWSFESEGTCDIYYHHPPDAIQRENRQERAAQEQGNLSPNLSGSREVQQRCIFAVVPPRPCATIKQPVS